MTDDDYTHAAWVMERMGGRFAGHIARAYYAADSDNKARLRAAFWELFEKYHAMYQQISQQEKANEDT
jgi:hypothetical protein